MANVNGIRAGKAYVELSVKTNNLIKNAQAGLAKLSSQLDSFSSSVTQKLTSAFAISVPAGFATKIFADFDDQMRIVQAVSGATGQAFDQLTEKAKELGRTTSFTASQVAEGMAGLGRAGFNSREIDEAIASVMALSKATATELPIATDIAGNSLRAFGLDASEMGRVCDVLTATANGSAQTVEDLGEALKFVAPIAATTGMTLEDTAKVLGTLANFGIKGSNAGTAFKNMRTKMADVNVQEKYRSIGVEVVDRDTGALRGLSDVIRDLGQAVADIPDADRLALFKEIFGMYGLAGGSVLTTAQGFDELYASIDNAAGAAEKTQAAMEAGLGGAIRSTLSACEGLAIAFGDALAPAVQELGDEIKSASGRLVAWITENKTAIADGAKLAAKIAAVAVATVAVTKTLSVATSIVRGTLAVVTGIGKALGFITGATKAFAAAQAAANAVTAANQAVETARIGVTMASTAAKQAQAAAALQAAVAEQAQAVATAQATAAVAAQTVAIGALVVAVAALAAVAGGIAYFTITAEKGAKAAKELSQAARDSASANAQARDKDKELFEELENLASQTELTNEEFARGKSIIDTLTSKYGDLGVSVDDVAKKFDLAADAKAKFNAAMRESEKKDIEAQIKALENENAEIDKSIKKYTDDGFSAMAVNYGRVIGSWFGADTAEERVSSLGADKEANQKELAALRQRLKAYNDLSASQEEQTQKQQEDQGVLERRKATATSAEFESNLDVGGKYEKERSEFEKRYSDYLGAQATLRDAELDKAQKARDEAIKKADEELAAAYSRADTQAGYDRAKKARDEAVKAAEQQMKDAQAAAKETYSSNVEKAQDWFETNVKPINAQEEREGADADRAARIGEAQAKVFAARLAFNDNGNAANKQALDDAMKELKDVETETRQETAQAAYDRLTEAAQALKDANASGNVAAIEAAQKEMIDAQRDAQAAFDEIEPDTKELASAGTFDAFEAFDMTNDWEREAMERQTEAIEEVAVVANDIKKAIEDGRRDENGVVFA